MRNVTHTLFGKVRLGRLGLPIWALAVTVVAMVAMVAAAGQAVGPVLAGQINGTAGLVVGQAIVLDTTASRAHVVTGGEDGVIVVNDDGTGFTAAVQAFRGQTAFVKLDLRNKGGQDAAAVLSIVAPRGVTVEASEATTSTPVTIAKMSRNTWLMKVPSGVAGGLNDIQLELNGDPGFFTIQATIVQIAGE